MPKRLRLELDTLRVESFETASRGGGARGTVRAHEYRLYTNDDHIDPPTWNYTCACPVPSNPEECTYFCASLSSCPTIVQTNQNCDTFPDICPL